MSSRISIALPKERNRHDHWDRSKVLSPVERAWLEHACRGSWSVLPVGSADKVDPHGLPLFLHWCVAFENADDAETFRTVMALMPNFVPEPRNYGASRPPVSPRRWLSRLLPDCLAGRVG